MLGLIQLFTIISIIISACYVMNGMDKSQSKDLTAVMMIIIFTVMLFFLSLFIYDDRYNQGQQDALIGKQKFTLQVDTVNHFKIKEGLIK